MTLPTDTIETTDSPKFIHITEEHLESVLEIEREAYPDPWSERMFRQEIDQNAAHFYVILYEGCVAGYIGFWQVVDEAHITSVTIRDRYRRRGFGLLAMEFILDKARHLGVRQATLEVRASNFRAQNLYTRMGFETLYRRRGYYNNQEDALVMVKNL